MSPIYNRYKHNQQPNSESNYWQSYCHGIAMHREKESAERMPYFCIIAHWQMAFFFNFNSWQNYFCIILIEF